MQWSVSVAAASKQVGAAKLINKEKLVLILSPFSLPLFCSPYILPFLRTPNEPFRFLNHRQLLRVGFVLTVVRAAYFFRVFNNFFRMREFTQPLKWRKKVLTIKQKLDAISRLEKGESAQKLALELDVFIQTIRDFKKQKQKLMEFTRDCVSGAVSTTRKVVKKS